MKTRVYVQACYAIQKMGNKLVIFIYIVRRNRILRISWVESTRVSIHCISLIVLSLIMWLRWWNPCHVVLWHTWGWNIHWTMCLCHWRLIVHFVY